MALSKRLEYVSMFCLEILQLIGKNLDEKAEEDSQVAQSLAILHAVFTPHVGVLGVGTSQATSVTESSSAVKADVFREKTCTGNAAQDDQPAILTT